VYKTVCACCAGWVVTIVAEAACGRDVESKKETTAHVFPATKIKRTWDDDLAALCRQVSA